LLRIGGLVFFMLYLSSCARRLPEPGIEGVFAGEILGWGFDPANQTIAHQAQIRLSIEAGKSSVIAVRFGPGEQGLYACLIDSLADPIVRFSLLPRKAPGDTLRFEGQRHGAVISGRISNTRGLQGTWTVHRDSAPL
jgi:hypothetical protein